MEEVAGVKDIYSAPAPQMRNPQGQEMAGGSLESRGRNVGNNSNRAHISVRVFLLFDDRPSSRSFARFHSSSFRPFSLLGRGGD